jgi:hypothetical protein
VEMKFNSQPFFDPDDVRVIYEDSWSKIYNKIIGRGGGHLILFQSKDIPTFYGGGFYGEDEPISSLVTLMVGGVFAGITCIGWSHQTSSLIELVGWRVCSLALPGIALLAMAFVPICGLLSDLRWSVLLGTFLYTTSRLLLVVLALLELRSLPSDAYEVVQWTALIPHV